MGGDAGTEGRLGIDCTPGTPGKENMSLVFGNDSGEFKGPAFSLAKSADGADGDGHDGAPPGTSGTSAVVPASEAGSARRSASVSAVSGGDEVDEGMAGIIGNGAPGAPGKENMALGAGNAAGAFRGPGWAPSARVKGEPGAP